MRWSSRWIYDGSALCVRVAKSLSTSRSACASGWFSIKVVFPDPENPVTRMMGSNGLSFIKICSLPESLRSGHQESAKKAEGSLQFWKIAIVAQKMILILPYHWLARHRACERRRKTTMKTTSSQLVASLRRPFWVSSLALALGAGLALSATAPAQAAPRMGMSMRYRIGVMEPT